MHQCWVPKAAYARLPTHFQQKSPVVAAATATKKPKTKSTMTNPSKQQTNMPTQKVWVPKSQKPLNASTMPPRCTSATSHWISKSWASPTTTKCAAKAPKPYPQQKPCPNLRASTQSHWIPKSALQAQGYYNGQRQIWLLKRPNPSPKPRTLSKQTSRMETSIVATTSSLQKPAKQVLLPKQQQPKSPTIKYQAQLLQCIFIHQLPQAVFVCIITALPLRPHICA